MSQQVLLMPNPPGTLGVYSFATQSGLIAATLAADSPLFSMRWGNANNYAIVDYLSVSVVISGAITAPAVHTGLEVVFARAFTASDSGGTALTITGNNGKLKTNFDTTLVTDLRIATTGTLTAGTRTLDTQALATVGYGTGTAVGTTALPHTILISRETNAYPVVLSQNEGLILRNPLAGPATGSFVVFVTLRWREMSKQVF